MRLTNVLKLFTNLLLVFILWSLATDGILSLLLLEITIACWLSSCSCLFNSRIEFSSGDVFFAGLRRNLSSELEESFNWLRDELLEEAGDLSGDSDFAD